MDTSRILRFGFVGAIGFIIDAGLLQALVSVSQWGPIEARLVSFPSAVAATWLLNRNLTFRAPQGVSALRSLTRYLAVSLAGAAINFTVYSALVIGSAAMAALPAIPLAIASVVALAANYLGSKHYVFR